ncbi:microtubule-associated protein [Anaeramoeba ignava]|uniref:Microtubule-associated protein n=1 Tax=Anaeramoeba ignava TaxID=1746090 RepID=A0A9Q0LIC4_ANAIG|nr:microtubule-associated protein [Anaeramoeba ignava]
MEERSVEIEYDFVSVINPKEKDDQWVTNEDSQELTREKDLKKAKKVQIVPKVEITMDEKEMIRQVQHFFAQGLAVFQVYILVPETGFEIKTKVQLKPRNFKIAIMGRKTIKKQYSALQNINILSTLRNSFLVELKIGTHEVIDLKMENADQQSLLYKTFRMFQFYGEDFLANCPIHGEILGYTHEMKALVMRIDHLGKAGFQIKYGHKSMGKKKIAGLLRLEKVSGAIVPHIGGEAITFSYTENAAQLFASSEEDKKLELVLEKPRRMETGIWCVSRSQMELVLRTFNIFSSEAMNAFQNQMYETTEMREPTRQNQKIVSSILTQDGEYKKEMESTWEHGEDQTGFVNMVSANFENRTARTQPGWREELSDEDSEGEFGALSYAQKQLQSGRIVYTQFTKFGEAQIVQEQVASPVASDWGLKCPIVRLQDRQSREDKMSKNIVHYLSSGVAQFSVKIISAKTEHPAIIKLSPANATLKTTITSDEHRMHYRLDYNSNIRFLLHTIKINRMILDLPGAQQLVVMMKNPFQRDLFVNAFLAFQTVFLSTDATMRTKMMDENLAVVVSPSPRKSTQSKKNFFRTAQHHSQFVYDEKDSTLNHLQQVRKDEIPDRLRSLMHRQSNYKLLLHDSLDRPVVHANAKLEKDHFEISAPSMMLRRRYSPFARLFFETHSSLKARFHIDELEFLLISFPSYEARVAFELDFQAKKKHTIGVSRIFWRAKTKEMDSVTHIFDCHIYTQDGKREGQIKLDRDCFSVETNYLLLSTDVRSDLGPKNPFRVNTSTPSVFQTQDAITLEYSPPLATKRSPQRDRVVFISMGYELFLTAKFATKEDAEQFEHEFDLYKSNFLSYLVRESLIRSESTKKFQATVIKNKTDVLGLMDITLDLGSLEIAPRTGDGQVLEVSDVDMYMKLPLFNAKVSFNPENPLKCELEGEDDSIIQFLFGNETTRRQFMRSLKVFDPAKEFCCTTESEDAEEMEPAYTFRVFLFEDNGKPFSHAKIKISSKEFVIYPKISAQNMRHPPIILDIVTTKVFVSPDNLRTARVEMKPEDPFLAQFISPVERDNFVRVFHSIKNKMRTYAMLSALEEDTEKLIEDDDEILEMIQETDLVEIPDPDPVDLSRSYEVKVCDSKLKPLYNARLRINASILVVENLESGETLNEHLYLHFKIQTSPEDISVMRIINGEKSYIFQFQKDELCKDAEQDLEYIKRNMKHLVFNVKYSLSGNQVPAKIILQPSFFIIESAAPAVPIPYLAMTTSISPKPSKMLRIYHNENAYSIWCAQIPRRNHLIKRLIFLKNRKPPDEQLEIEDNADQDQVQKHEDSLMDQQKKKEEELREQKKHEKELKEQQLKEQKDKEQKQREKELKEQQEIERRKNEKKEKKRIQREKELKEQQEKDQKLKEQREREEKEQREKDQKEKDRLALLQKEKDQKEKDQKEKDQKEKDRLALLQKEKDQKEKDRLALLQKEKDQKEKDRLALLQKEKDQKEKDRLALLQKEKDQKEKDRLALLQKEKEEREKKEKEEREQKEKEEREQKEKDRLALLQKEKEEREKKEKEEREQQEKEQQEKEQLQIFPIFIFKKKSKTEKDKGSFYLYPDKIGLKIDQQEMIFFSYTIPISNFFNKTKKQIIKIVFGADHEHEYIVQFSTIDARVKFLHLLSKYQLENTQKEQEEKKDPNKQNQPSEQKKTTTEEENFTESTVLFQDAKTKEETMGSVKYNAQKIICSMKNTLDKEFIISKDLKLRISKSSDVLQLQLDDQKILFKFLENSEKENFVQKFKYLTNKSFKVFILKKGSTKIPENVHAKVTIDGNTLSVTIKNDQTYSLDIPQTAKVLLSTKRLEFAKILLGEANELFFRFSNENASKAFRDQFQAR